MKKILSMFLIIALALVVTQGCQNKSEPVQPQNTDNTNLPDIQVFKTNPSDRFLVDIRTINAGHPFKGRRANTPHQGAHTHWDNSDNTWPKGGAQPDNYPVIYAVADGIIERVDYSYPVGENDRYGIDIAFAENDTSVFLFSYSIEPLIPEPSADFYRQFIRVTENQHVTKGDTIAYMYLPASPGIGCHIHFHIQQKNQNNFLAPAIFSSGGQLLCRMGYFRERRSDSDAALHGIYAGCR